MLILIIEKDLKNDNFEDIFRSTNNWIKRFKLCYYNWISQRVFSNDCTFFKVDAGNKERLSFRNNTDKKIINVNLEYLDQHYNLDVKRKLK